METFSPAHLPRFTSCVVVVRCPLMAMEMLAKRIEYKVVY
jgi:hypothetical protein